MESLNDHRFQTPAVHEIKVPKIPTDSDDFIETIGSLVVQEAAMVDEKPNSA